MPTKKYLELRELSDSDLISELDGAEADYQKMRFDHYVKGLDNPLQLRDLRRDIARIRTEVRHREMSQMTDAQVDGRSKLRARRKRK